MYKANLFYYSFDRQFVDYNCLIKLLLSLYCSERGVGEIKKGLIAFTSCDMDFNMIIEVFDMTQVAWRSTVDFMKKVIKLQYPNFWRLSIRHKYE